MLFQSPLVKTQLHYLNGIIILVYQCGMHEYHNYAKAAHETTRVYGLLYHANVHDSVLLSTEDSKL